MAVGGLIALAVGVYIGLRHPLWLYWGMAIAVGTLPFGYFPGVHLPLYLPFAGGALVAALVHPNAAKRFPVLSSTLAKSVLVLVVISGVSMVLTFSSIVNILDYTKWAIATGAFFALLALPQEHLARFGRIFVYAASFNALIGIGSIVLGSNQILLQPFRIFGYAVANTERFFFTGGTAANRGEGRFEGWPQNSQAFSRPRRAVAGPERRRHRSGHLVRDRHDRLHRLAPRGDRRDPGLGHRADAEPLGHRQRIGRCRTGFRVPPDALTAIARFWSAR